MSYSKDKKDKKKKQATSTVSTKLKSGWQQKRPVFLFVGGFAVLIILFYTVWLSDFFNDKIHPRIISTNANLAGIVLNLLSQHTRTSRELIYSTIFSISVARGCDAIEAMALFASALLAFPIKWMKKIKGLIMGIAVLFLLNIVRIVSLFLTGVYANSWFDIMHVEVWQVLFIFSSLALWIYCIKPDSKKLTKA